MLDFIALFLIFVCTILIIWGIVIVHDYPVKVARKRNHPQSQAIFVTSLLGLIIFPLWMLALVWAYSNAVIGKLYNEGDKNAAGENTGDPTFKQDSQVK
jgi:uncharacterized membrane protein